MKIKNKIRLSDVKMAKGDIVECFLFIFDNNTEIEANANFNFTKVGGSVISAANVQIGDDVIMPILHR